MKTAKISDVRKNIMGTTSFDMKAGSMRKPEEFIVYPIREYHDPNIIWIQSDNRAGKIYLETGKGILSGRHSHPAFSCLSYDIKAGKARKFELSNLDNQALRMQVFTSANKEAGKRENGIIQTDNSGAINILDI